VRRAERKLAAHREVIRTQSGQLSSAQRDLMPAAIAALRAV
jgi:hypothetical protein